jgi:hypothetical protein
LCASLFLLLLLTLELLFSFLYQNPKPKKKNETQTKQIVSTTFYFLNGDRCRCKSDVDVYVTYLHGFINTSAGLLNTRLQRCSNLFVGPIPPAGTVSNIALRISWKKYSK